MFLLLYRDIILQMKNRNYKQTINSQSEILLFGKFKHCTIQHVLRTEPSYILWLSNEKIVKFSQEILNLAMDKDIEMNYSDFGHNYSSYYDD